MKNPAGFAPGRRCLAALLTMLCLLAAAPRSLALPGSFTAAPAHGLVAGTTSMVSVVFLNDQPRAVSTNLPARLQGTLAPSAGQPQSVVAELAPGQPPTAQLAPNAFARRDYSLCLPPTPPGPATLTWANLDAPAVTLQILPPPATAKTPDLLPTGGTNAFANSHLAGSDPFGDAGKFFQRHLFGYEPVYFIWGPESPSAKFQFSFRYRLFDPESDWTRNTRLHPLTNFYFAYTQLSLWDLSKPSAPFLDTNYRPELFYAQRLWGGSNAWFSRPTDDPRDWWSIDLQSGFMHESNGRDGLNSRSLNEVYFKPSLRVGYPEAINFTLSPRAWFYVADLSDNPDIDDYRGNVELSARLAWGRYLCLSSLLRGGNEFQHLTSLTDFSFTPWPKKTGLTWRFHVQYFNGYGESLLFYRTRTDMLRFGLSLYH